MTLLEATKRTDAVAVAVTVNPRCSSVVLDSLCSHPTPYINAQSSCALEEGITEGAALEARYARR